MADVTRKCDVINNYGEVEGIGEGHHSRDIHQILGTEELGVIGVVYQRPENKTEIVKLAQISKRKVKL